MRSVAAAQSKVKDSEYYFIQRNGYWFRPNAAGYTSEIIAAGIYKGADARGYLAAEGVTLFPVKNELARIESYINTLKKQIEIFQGMMSMASGGAR